MSDDEIRRMKDAYRSYQEGAAALRWSEANPGNAAILRERSRWMTDLLRRAGFEPLKDRRILEIGCGSGAILRQFVAWGADPSLLVGVDVREDALDRGRDQLPGVRFEHANAECLDFPDGHFDLVLLFTVLSSTFENETSFRIARETMRVVKPGGGILLYDFRVNNPANPSVRGISRASLQRHFEPMEVSMHPITLLPPLSRRLGRLTNLLYAPLAAIPYLRTHHIGLLRTPARTSDGARNVQNHY